MTRKRERRQQPGAIHYQIETSEVKGFKNKSVRWKTNGQREYMETVDSNDITICTGPAGTGKSHLACGLAVEAMKNNEVNRIILTRPTGAMENDIGFLPGGILEKLGPSLRPLFDELGYFCFQDLLQEWIEKGQLEICPLSAMRGRTFKNSFIILDEAQNASFSYLKMFFTRLGEGSKMVATGDLNQSDLQGALAEVIDRLHGLVGIVSLTAADVVRHKLTAEIDRRLG